MERPLKLTKFSETPSSNNNKTTGGKKATKKGIQKA